MPHDQGRPIPGVAITGTVGKTAVAEALSNLLHSKRTRHALIDVDWLGQVYPPPNPDHPHCLDLALTNLAATAPNFVSAGARYFVIAITMTSRGQLNELRRALPQVSITVCRIDASSESLPNGSDAVSWASS